MTKYGHFLVYERRLLRFFVWPYLDIVGHMTSIVKIPNGNVFAHFRFIHKLSVVDVIVTTIVVDVTLKTIYCDVILITLDVEMINGLLGASDAVIPDCKPIRLFI